MELVTVDPGVKYIATALWHWSSVPKVAPHLVSCGWYWLADGWPEWFVPEKYPVLCEGQDLYKGTANRKAVLGLARTTGAVLARALPGAAQTRDPHIWKRQLSRNATHSLVLKHLSLEEMAGYGVTIKTYTGKGPQGRPVKRGMTLNMQRDVTAAIGIGLVEFGRLVLKPGMETK